LHFDATLASWPPTHRPGTHSLSRPKETLPKHLAGALLPFSISGLKDPSGAKQFAFLFGRSVLRVWLPSLRLFSPPSPRKPLSAPNTLGLLPSELSSSPGGQVHVPMNPLRSCTSSKNLPASELCFSVFLPPEKPFPLCSPDGYSRAGTLALLGLPTSQVSPSQRSRKKASPFLPSPLILLSSTSLNMENRNPRVFSPVRLGSLPP